MNDYIFAGLVTLAITFLAMGRSTECCTNGAEQKRNRQRGSDFIRDRKRLLARSRKSRCLDAALIAAAQAVEHYEMTRYGTLISWAKQPGHNDVVTLLNQTLDEEKADRQEIDLHGRGRVNRKAA